MCEVFVLYVKQQPLIRQRYRGLNAVQQGAEKGAKTYSLDHIVQAKLHMKTRISQGSYRVHKAIDV